MRSSEDIGCNKADDVERDNVRGDVANNKEEAEEDEDDEDDSGGDRDCFTGVVTTNSSNIFSAFAVCIKCALNCAGVSMAKRSGS